MFKIWYFRKGEDSHYELDRLAEVCTKNGIDLHVVHPKYFDIIVTRTDRRSIRYRDEVVDLPAIVLARTGAATDYHALSVLRHLERMHVRVINTTDAIETVKDKLYTAQLLAQAELPTPKTMLVRFPVDSDLVEKQLGFPCVVKVLHGTHGNGIHLCRTKEHFTELMDFVVNLNTNMNILIQEYIGDRAGEDLRVLVIGNEVVGAMKRKSSEGDFRANVSRGGTGERYELNERIIELSLRTAQVLGLDIAGIDLLFDGDDFKICEANSSPGFAGFEKYTKQNIAEKIVDYTLRCGDK